MWSDGGVDVTFVEPNPEFISCPMSNLVLGGSKTLADITVSYDNLTKRHGVKIVRDTATGDRHREAHGEARRRRRAAVRPADPVAGHRLHVGQGARAQQRPRAGDDPALVEGRRADRGVAPPARGDARRRRLRAVDPGRAVSLPAGALRARVPGRLVLQAGQAEVEGADPRRQRRRHVEGAAVQEGLGRGVQGHRRVPGQPRADRCRRRRRARRSSRCRTP